MGLQKTRTREQYQRALKVMPYGVNSNFRYWGLDDTLVMTRGQGAYLWDSDGRKYIDYRMGFGPVFLGHGFPEVAERVSRAVTEDGNIFAFTTEKEIELAERIVAATGVDMARLANSGTEATMHSLRIARAHTGREKFIKFEGQYHGMSDYFLYSTASAGKGTLGSRRNPINVVQSSGIPKGIAEYVINLPYNDLEILESTVEAKWGDLAAIIVEPTMGNSGGIMPAPGWLEKIRELCTAHGIVMIMDEVKTGFRLALGGAQQLFSVRGDLVTYAKALGNGFPIAVIAGKRAFMETLEPGSVAHGGTYTGNFVGVAAALATLDVMQKQPVHKTVNERGQMLMSGLGEILTDAGVPHSVVGVPSMFGLYLGEGAAPVDFRSFLEADHALYDRIIVQLAERGVLPEMDDREPWFISYSHTEADIAETLTKFEEAVKVAKTS